jgi:TRAP transporter TAXI family solute receptor
MYIILALSFAQPANLSHETHDFSQLRRLARQGFEGMRRVSVRIAIAVVALAVCFEAIAAIASAQEVATASSRYNDRKRQANENTVSIVTSGIHCTCTRFADDMRSILNDMSPNGLRLLPIVGVGGVQNLQDMLFLKGVDMAVVDQDVFDKIRKKDPGMYANVSQRIHYITKLYNAEFHVLARADIKSFEDLVGKKVNVQLRKSTTAVAAESIFASLGIKAEFTYYDDSLSLEKLREGDIAALAILTGAPRAVLTTIRKEEGLHFLPLDDESLPNRDLSGLYVTYLPTELTHDFYPNLIPPGESIPTVANRAILAAYAWPYNSERYKRVAKFVTKFFDNFDKFHERSRHIKWREVNLAAEVPGWTRFRAAREWLENRENSVANEGSEMKAAFDRFVEVYARTAGGKSFTASEREALFAQFRTIWDAQRMKRASQ